MKKLALAALVLLCALATLPADPINFNTASIKMDTPKGWEYEIADDGSMISITSPDGLVSVAFVPLSASTLSAALDAAEQSILESSPDAVFGDPENFKLNGLDVVEVAGTGTLEGTEVTISVDVIKAKVPVMVVAYIAAGGEKHDATLEKFIKTIKKM